MDKKKILLAVGHRQLEEFLEKKLNIDYDFVGPTVHREGIVKILAQEGADIVVIRETLEGTENIMSVVYNIRSSYPKTRIVFLAGNRKPGDELLATLVNYGVYDILYGANIPANDIIDYILNPKSHADVAHLQPVPKLDEKRNRVMLEHIASEDEEDEDIEDEIENTEDDLNTDKKGRTTEGKESKIKKITQGIKLPQIPSIPSPRKKEDKIEKINKSAKNRIITFIGGKNGVGTSSIAINVACELASLKKKVIYLEVNEHYPAVSYWFELGSVSEGIDSAMDAISKERYDGIQGAIIKTVDIRKEDSPLKSSYKKFPDLLDFMFFSKEYITGLKGTMELKLTKELYMHLLYQEGYDYVIIDVQPDISNHATLNGLIYSNIVFSVITQDVSSVGYHLFHMNELEKKGLMMNSKNFYLINRYEDVKMRADEIKDWVGVKSIITIPSANKDFITANLNGVPVTIDSQNNDLKNSFIKIIKKITED